MYRTSLPSSPPRNHEMPRASSCGAADKLVTILGTGSGVAEVVTTLVLVPSALVTETEKL